MKPTKEPKPGPRGTSEKRLKCACEPVTTSTSEKTKTHEVQSPLMNSCSPAAQPIADVLPLGLAELAVLLAILSLLRLVRLA